MNDERGNRDVITEETKNRGVGNFMTIIGITGGIGSGKSVVSRILRCEGYIVYDCDYEARELMNRSLDIKERISKEISDKVTDGVAAPDRKLLAEIVFANEESRQILNDIVHGAVREDILRRVEPTEKETVSVRNYMTAQKKIFFIESAILAESGLAAVCDRIWLIDGGEEEDRISRVVKRDGTDQNSVRMRILSQSKERKLLNSEMNKIEILVNKSGKSLINEIKTALAR